MRASDLVTTESQRAEASLGLARTELNDAVNTGIVASADHGASLVLDPTDRDVARSASAQRARVADGPAAPQGEGVTSAPTRLGGDGASAASGGLNPLDQHDAVNATASPKSGPRATGAAAMARRAVSSTLAGSEIEGLDTIAYVGYYGAKAAAGGVGCLPIALVFILILLIPLLFMILGGGAASETPGLEGNERIVAEYLLDKGLDEVQVAAIIGNMYKESGVDPAAVNEDSGAFGLCQWLGGRLNGLRAFCDARDVPYTDISAQLDFFWDEFTMARGGGWSFRSNYDDFMACLNDDQLETAVEIFARHFERCGLDEMNLPNRNEHARRVLDALRTGGGAIAGVGDLQWPSDTPQWGTYADHWGLDIQAGMGTPVFASADGIVVNAKFVGTWGNYVRINHGSLGVQTGYAHLSRFAVSEGDHVRKGQVIGYVGSTGNSTGPHLHYEIYERNSDRPGDTGGTPIYDDMAAWGKYFDRKALEANRVW